MTIISVATSQIVKALFIINTAMETIIVFVVKVFVDIPYGVFNYFNKVSLRDE